MGLFGGIGKAIGGVGKGLGKVASGMSGGKASGVGAGGLLANTSIGRDAVNKAAMGMDAPSTGGITGRLGRKASPKLSMPRRTFGGRR